jgi:hypothetical protein
LQNPKQTNGDNLNSVTSENRRAFRNKMKEYLKEKITELETNNTSKNIRHLYSGINEFMKSRLSITSTG